jgi:hypothetical protein
VQFTMPAQFINGTVHIEKGAAPGFEEVVAARARALLGQNYGLFSFSCKHLANDAAEGKRESPQLQGAMLGSALIAGLWWLARAGNAGPSYALARMLHGPDGLQGPTQSGEREEFESLAMKKESVARLELAMTQSVPPGRRDAHAAALGPATS